MSEKSTIIEINDLAEKVLYELSTRDLTLAIAESCTGGLASSVLTDIDGASDVLLYSVVAYSQDSKEEFLGIPTYIIRDFGTISKECARYMAEGIMEYDADIGLATTGVIGESIEEKLKGTIFLAIAINGHKTYSKELHLDPKLSRNDLKLEIIKELFEMLLAIIDSIF
ncbi:MAG: CinA family protein [Asgard group archaeon]|nr:CinA family protein [Asgard group archaeon]